MNMNNYEGLWCCAARFLEASDVEPGALAALSLVLLALAVRLPRTCLGKGIWVAVLVTLAFGMLLLMEFWPSAALLLLKGFGWDALAAIATGLAAWFAFRTAQTARQSIEIARDELDDARRAGAPYFTATLKALGHAYPNDAPTPAQRTDAYSETARPHEFVLTNHGGDALAVALFCDDLTQSLPDAAPRGSRWVPLKDEDVPLQHRLTIPLYSAPNGVLTVSGESWRILLRCVTASGDIHWQGWRVAPPTLAELSADRPDEFFYPVHPIVLEDSDKIKPPASTNTYPWEGEPWSQGRTGTKYLRRLEQKPAEPVRTRARRPSN